MEKPQLPAARRFVDQIRALYAQDLGPNILWSKIKDAMGPLLADPSLKKSSKTWPLTVEGAPKVKNLLFYEDPDFGFVFNATVRKANSVTSVHDHGDVWTLYGLIEGHETMYRYERSDKAPRDTGACTTQTDRLSQYRTWRRGCSSTRQHPSGTWRPRKQHGLHRPCTESRQLQATDLQSGNW